MNTFHLISNYNYDPQTLIDLLEGDYVIFDQSNQFYLSQNLVNSRFYFKAKHTGHNLSDYFYYIINNFNKLPERIAFLKGNIVGRHIDKDDFIKRLQLPGCVSLYSDKKTYHPKIQLFRFIAQQIAPGVFLEINNNWYCKTRSKGKYHPTFNDLFQKLFSYTPPKYIPFIPGACFIATRDKILQWDIEIYKHLYHITTYEFFPVEAYHVERMIMYLFFFNMI